MQRLFSLKRLESTDELRELQCIVQNSSVNAFVEDPNTSLPARIFILRYTDDIVGWVSLFNISKVNLSAELGIVVIKPIGSLVIIRAVAQVIKYAFNLGLHRIEAKVLETNTRCLRILESDLTKRYKYKFIFESRKRKAAKTNSGYEDILVYSLLKEDIGGDLVG